MVSVLAALAPSYEHSSFVEIHWFDTGWFSQADCPADHRGPLKAFSPPGEQSEDRWRPLQWVGLHCQGPGPVSPFLWQTALHPHLFMSDWSQIAEQEFDTPLSEPPQPLQCLEAFPTLQGWGPLSLRPNSPHLPKVTMLSPGKGHIPVGPLDF